MPQEDQLYLQLLQACQSDDLEQRLEAMEGLSKHEYLDQVPVAFWLGRLSAASIEREQVALLRLMGRLEEPLPEEALDTLLGLLEAFTPAQVKEVVSRLSVGQAEEVLNLL